MNVTEETMTNWQAFVRGIRRAFGLPVEKIDSSPEAQLVRLAERLEREGGSTPAQRKFLDNLRDLFE